MWPVIGALAARLLLGRDWREKVLVTEDQIAGLAEAVQEEAAAMGLTPRATLYVVVEPTDDRRAA